MTILIYRGVTHIGQQTHRPLVAQALIYRGVPHDGLSAEPTARLRTIPMLYRGVAYTIAPDGARRDNATAIGASGQVAPAPAPEQASA